MDSPPIVAPAKAPDPIVVGVPHGGAIVEVAVTERGDAALTADTLGAVRLWPSLDGKRQPIPIAAMSPDQLALAHAGDDLLAAILDEAGDLRILRLGLDGSVRGRVQIPNETAIQQVVAVDGGVLVRRADQTLERYDATGAVTGKLVPEPGERIPAVAVRNGSAIAEVTSELRADRELRWIVLGDQLRWGTSVMLPTPYEPGSLALSPDHVHVAIAEASATAIYEVVPTPKRVGSMPHITSDAPELGFIDAEQLVEIDRSMHRWWTVSAAQDPWSTQMRDVQAEAEAGAVGNGVAVSGMGAALVLEDGSHKRYLGWSRLAQGELSVTPGGDLYVMNGTVVTWLDDDLQEKRTIDLKTVTSDSPYGSVLDDRHVLVQVSRGDKWEAEVVDATDTTTDHSERIKIGTDDAYALVQYRPESHVLTAGRSELHRWRIDFAKRTATPLPPLVGAGTASQLYAFDPAHAHGALALTQTYDDDSGYYKMRPYFESTNDQPIDAGKAWTLRGALIAIDAEGNSYIEASGAETLRKFAPDGTSSATKISYAGGMSSTVISHDGTLMASIGNSALRMVDVRDGRVLWTYALWAASTQVFTRDDRRLVVRASNGQIVLDVLTGKRISATCGWDFGVHDDAPPVTTFGAQPACED